MEISQIVQEILFKKMQAVQISDVFRGKVQLLDIGN